jgi:hypothetical protein
MISRKEFLTNRDETGRLIVQMLDGTGKQYFVEFIEPKGGIRTNWGSYNPSTGNIENKKGAGKYTGGIQAQDSMITKENGFENIVEGAGGSFSHQVTEMHENWKQENGY